MDQKELVSGNRDPLLEFADTMAQWYHSFMAARSKQRDQIRSPCRKYPLDSSPCWIVHVMDCSGPAPVAGRLKRAGIRLSELKKYDEKSMLMVTDASGLPLGFDTLDEEWSSCNCFKELAQGEHSGATKTFYKIVELLQRCMDAPMGGGMPRRFRRLKVNDKILHRLLQQLILQQGNKILDAELWIQAFRDLEVLDQERLSVFSLRWPPVHYCNICKRRSFPSQLQECSQCKAVFYCADKCSLADSEHEHWCAKMASYLDHEGQLADLPFSYAAEVTSEDFSLEDFLCKNKLVSNYWVHWSLLVHSPQPQIIPTDAYCIWLAGHSKAYEPLEEEAQVLMFGPNPHNPPRFKKPLVSWHQYYEWRGLSLSSVVAPLLSSPLSIYYILTSLVPKHFPELHLLKKRSLRIHILESYKEFHTLVTFRELSVLLPHVTFELVFICGHLPSWCDKMQLLIQKTNGRVTVTDLSWTSHEKANKGSITVRVYRSIYHKLQEPEPDLVIGFRPAFLLNDSWFSTLPKLQALRVPAFFCEISELRCESSQQVMSKATGGAVSPPTINPFHCPLRINGGDNKLPRYSNGFIFHLLYKPVANIQHSGAQPDHTQSPLESPHLTFKERKVAGLRRRHKKAKVMKKKRF